MMSKCFALLLGGALLLNQASQIQGAEELEQKVVEVAIGSTNKVKVQAVKNALNDGEFRVVAYAAESNVRRQPLSNEETLQGAINRARDCLEKTGADLAVGLEAGILFIQNQAFLCHWGAIVDRHQYTYFTNGPLILLPAEFKKPLLEGKNLEDLMLSSTGIDKLGEKEGAIGIYTSGRLNREQVLTQMVQALVGQYYYYTHNKHAK
jgi:inosine/xanthosine triphosphatase